MQEVSQSSRIGLISGLTAASIWGGMYVVSKVVLEVIPPFALVSLRLILGILVLWVVVQVQGRTPISPRQILRLVAVGWVGYGVSLGLQFTGTKLSTASNGALVTSATPAFVLLFAARILSERITQRRLVALFLATLGVIAVIDPHTAHLSPDLFLGNIILVGAALTWALYSVLVRKVTHEIPVLPATMVFFWGGLIISLPASAWELQTIGLGEVDTGVIAGVIYLGVISTALAMYLWNYAFAKLEAGIASLTFFAQPVVGVGLGALLLGEQLTPMFLFGGLLIGLGLWLAAREA
jgi:drug/metabolite transporter (DMT)-like permease